MKKIKINFVDFWPNLLKDDNYFYNLLKTKYDVEIDETNPDVLFFSVDYGNARERDRYKNCLKVFYTGEDVAPNWNECDLAYTFRHSTDSREYRLPLWALYFNWFNRPYNDDRDQALLWDMKDFLNKPTQVNKPNFCGFINMQPKGKRVEFVPKLMNYKKVDCAGPLYHNTPYVITDSRGNLARGDQKYKVDWLSSYKFSVSMENCCSLGYCTEKIIHAMFANCIPIYWGSESVNQDFNENSFINCHKFSSDEEVIEKIKELDSDNRKYAKMLMGEPWFNDNKIPEFVQPDSVLTLLSNKLD
jgi:hypothetical protein